MLELPLQSKSPVLAGTAHLSAFGSYYGRQTAHVLSKLVTKEVEKKHDSFMHVTIYLKP
jgi:hypothetical protein